MKRGADLTTAMASSCAWTRSLSRVGRDRRSDTRDVEERRGSSRVWLAMVMCEAGTTWGQVEVLLEVGVQLAGLMVLGMRRFQLK